VGELFNSLARCVHLSLCRGQQKGTSSCFSFEMMDVYTGHKETLADKYIQISFLVFIYLLYKDPYFSGNIEFIPQFFLSYLYPIFILGPC